MYHKKTTLVSTVCKPSASELNKQNLILKIMPFKDIEFTYCMTCDMEQTLAEYFLSVN